MGLCVWTCPQTSVDLTLRPPPPVEVGLNKKKVHLPSLQFIKLTSFCCSLKWGVDSSFTGGRVVGSLNLPSPGIFTSPLGQTLEKPIPLGKALGLSCPILSSSVTFPFHPQRQNQSRGVVFPGSLPTLPGLRTVADTTSPLRSLGSQLTSFCGNRILFFIPRTPQWRLREMSAVRGLCDPEYFVVILSHYSSIFLWKLCIFLPGYLSLSPSL